MKVNKSLIAIFASALALGSCTDFNNGFDSTSAQYQDSFKDLFGQIDPSQDWSLAKHIDVNVYGVDGGTLEVYDKDPFGSDARILARKKVIDGNATVGVDVAKGLNKVFACVNKGKGYYPVKGYFKIEDGQVNLNMATRTGGIEFTGNSRVRKGEPVTYTPPKGMIDWANQGDNIIFNTANKDTDAKLIDGNYISTSQTSSNIDLPSSFYTQQTIENIIPLYDVIDKTDERPFWYVSDIAHFFYAIDDEPATFAEGENHVKFMKEGSKPHFEKDLVFTIGKGGSTVLLDYFFEGTAYTDRFGYFYFTGDIPTMEEFKTMPKFQLVDNLNGDGAEYTINETTKRILDLLQYRSIGAYESGGQNGLGGVFPPGDNPQYGKWDNRIYGTRLPLTYFGENYDAEVGTYEFPEGTKIGFFLISDQTGQKNVHTSISSLNLKMFNEFPHGAAFRYNDQIVYAMEDQDYFAADADINDVMFIVDGNFSNDIEEIKPSGEKSGETWVVACEDLGGVYDYDFNDVVIGIRKTPNEDGETAKLEIVPLAAGGTFPAQLMYKKEDGTYNNLGEIHALLGATSTDVPINAEAGAKPELGTAILISNSIPASTTINDIKDNLALNVTLSDQYGGGDKQSNRFISANVKDEEDDESGSKKATQMILLPAGWDWPSEGTLVSDIYPEFANWVSDTRAVAWYHQKGDGVTKFVTNPFRSAAITDGQFSDDEEEGGSGSSDAINNKYKLTLLGSSYIQPGATNTYTLSVGGHEWSEIKDKVTITSYSTMLTVTQPDDDGKFTAKVDASATKGTQVRFSIRVAADDEHVTTRAEYRLTVDYPEAQFTVTPEELTVKVGESVNFTINNVLGSTNAYTYSIEDSEIASLNGGDCNYYTWDKHVKGVSVGTTYLIVKHAATEGQGNTYRETIKKIKVNVVAAGGGSGEGGEGGGSEADPVDYSQYGTQVSLVDGKDSNPALISKSDVLAVKNSGDITITFICESNNGGSWINWSNDGSSTVGGASVSNTSISIGTSVIPGTSYYPVTISATASALQGCEYSHLGISLWNNAKVVQVRVK